MADPDLRALQESWIIRLRAERKAEGTVRLYATGVRAFLSWCDRQGRPATLDRLTVAAFVAELLNDGREAATARAPVAQFHARPATALQRNGRRLVAADTHSDARP